MKVKLGPDCQNCPAYKEFFNVLKDCETELEARAIQIGDEHMKAWVAPAKFICGATVQTECDVDIEPAKPEFHLPN